MPYVPYKKLSEHEWLEITHLVENGESPVKVAKQFGVHSSVVYRTLKKRGVQFGSNAKLAAEEASRQDREKLVERIKETKEQDYRYTQALQQMVMSTLVDAKKLSRPAGAVADDIKALKLAMDAIHKGTDNKWRILGLDSENADADRELPELPIRELTEREIEAIRNRQELEDGGFDLPEGEDPDIEILEESEQEPEEEAAF